MTSKLLGLVSIIGALVIAGGAYFILRHDPAVGSSPAAAIADAGLTDAGPGAEPVRETEIVLEEELEVEVDTPPAADVAPRPAANRPAPRSEAPRAAPEPASEVIGLEGTWPSRAAERRSARDEEDAMAPIAPGPSAPVSVSHFPSAQSHPVPAPPLFEELVVSADSVIGLQFETAVTSEQAKVEDRVEARVTRDVRVGSDVAIPAGTMLAGSVTLVEIGGKVRERARIGVRFHTLVLADGAEVPIRTDTIYREGESPAAESTAKIGGAAVGGAIIGGILGGSRGAAIGGAAGAGAGTAATLAGDRNPATIPAGTTLTVRLQAPVTVTIEREY